MRPVFAAAVLLCCMVAAQIALAGDLAPPPGPATSTMKSLAQVEPRAPLNLLPGDEQYTVLITQSGSYYLTADIQGAADKQGIGIAADHVTIDLNGFNLIGGAGVGNVGIVAINQRAGITIRNGSISGWSYASLGSAGHMRDCLFESLTLIGNSAGGLEQPDVDNSVFRNIRVVGSAEVGISAGQNCLIQQCVIDQCSIGVNALFNSTIVECQAANCGAGIILVGSGLIDRCATSNCQTGLAAGQGASIRASTATVCEIGVLLNGFARVDSCIIQGAGQAGVRLSWRAQVSRCRIDGCPVAIHAFDPFGGSNVISDNSISSCPIGVKLTSSGNTLVRNIVTDASTAAFDIVPGNVVGSILATPVGAGAWDNIAH